MCVFVLCWQSIPYITYKVNGNTNVDATQITALAGGHSFHSNDYNRTVCRCECWNMSNVTDFIATLCNVPPCNHILNYIKCVCSPLHTHTHTYTYIIISDCLTDIHSVVYHTQSQVFMLINMLSSDISIAIEIANT